MNMVTERTRENRTLNRDINHSPTIMTLVTNWDEEQRVLSTIQLRDQLERVSPPKSCTVVASTDHSCTTKWMSWIISVIVNLFVYTTLTKQIEPWSLSLNCILFYSHQDFSFFHLKTIFYIRFSFYFNLILFFLFFPAFIFFAIFSFSYFHILFF